MINFCSSNQQNTTSDLSQRNLTAINQLAIAHCLYAHCAQEGNNDKEEGNDDKVTTEDTSCVLFLMK